VLRLPIISILSGIPEANKRFKQTGEEVRRGERSDKT